MAGIVLTTDLSAESKRAFVPTRLLALRLGLPITLAAVLEHIPFEPIGGGFVAVAGDPESIRSVWQTQLDKLVEELGRDACKGSVILDGVDIAHALVEFARREQADYIAMATHGRSGLRRLLLGSVAEAVLRRSHVPVIVFPPPAV